ncbi:hypothetical protein RB600_010135 [Gaeumannomyces tritici]
MRLTSVVTALLVGATEARPPQANRTSDVYKWRLGKIKCATMPTALADDIRSMKSWLQLAEGLKFYIPPVQYCYRPQCKALNAVAVYKLIMTQNNTETITIRGKYLLQALVAVDDNCCNHMGSKLYPKSGTVTFPAAGVTMHVGATDCFNNNDWANPLAMKGPNNCLMDAGRFGAPLVYQPGANHTCAWEPNHSCE